MVVWIGPRKSHFWNRLMAFMNCIIIQQTHRKERVFIARSIVSVRPRQNSPSPMNMIKCVKLWVLRVPTHLPAPTKRFTSTISLQTWSVSGWVWRLRGSASPFCDCFTRNWKRCMKRRISHWTAMAIKSTRSCSPSCLKVTITDCKRPLERWNT